MILSSLYLKNFKQYLNQKIEFPEGLIGISGKNGSGKSSIFEAVLLALYGEIPFKKEYLRSNRAGDKDPVRVELVFEVVEKTYRVIREFRGRALTPSGSIYDHNNVMIAGGQSETTAEIVKITGMGSEAFTRSIFSGQKELGALSDTKGAERRTLIRRMIGMEKIDSIQTLIRSDRNRLKNEEEGQRKMLLSLDEIQKMEAELVLHKKQSGSLEETITGVQKNLQLAEKKYEEAKKQFSVMLNLFQDHTKASAVLAELKLKHENSSANLKETLITLKKLETDLERQNSLLPSEKEYHEITAAKEAMDQQHKKFIAREGLIRSLKSGEDELASIKTETAAAASRLKNLMNLPARTAAAEGDLAAAEKSISEKTLLRNSLDSSRGRILQLIAEREESVKKITSAGRDSECPTCLRPLKEAYDLTLDKLSSDIRVYQEGEIKIIETGLKETSSEIKSAAETAEKHKAAINSLHKLTAEKTEIEKTISALNKKEGQKSSAVKDLLKDISAIGEIQWDEKSYKTLTSRLAELTVTHELFVKLSASAARIPEENKKAFSLKEEIQTLADRISRGEIHLQKIPYSADEYKRSEQEQSSSEEIRDKLSKENQELKEKSAEQHRMIKEIESSILRNRQLAEKIEKTSLEKKSLDKLELLMEGFKNAVLDRVKPSIRENASSLFQQVTSGRYESIEIDDDFNFLIMDEGQYYPIQRFSGGEVDLANLCLRLSISRAIRDLSGAGSSGFLGFDEIFGSQDNERRSEILRAFQYLGEMYRQIFIVSHIDDVKEEFPRLLEVTRTPEGSQVRWVEN